MSLIGNPFYPGTIPVRGNTENNQLFDAYVQRGEDIARLQEQITELQSRIDILGEKAVKDSGKDGVYVFLNKSEDYRGKFTTSAFAFISKEDWIAKHMVSLFKLKSEVSLLRESKSLVSKEEISQKATTWMERFKRIFKIK